MHARRKCLIDRLNRLALLVTHDLAEAARLADQVVVMKQGRIEQAGTVRELQRAPATPYVAELFERARAAGAALEQDS